MPHLLRVAPTHSPPGPQFHDVAPWPRREPAAAFGRGQVIWRSNVGPPVLHRVLSGRVRLQRIGPRGEPSLLSVLGPGDVFGTVGTNAEVLEVAVADGAEVWRTTSSDLAAFCAAEPLAAAELLCRTAECVQRERRRIGELAHRDIPSLVCRTLLDLGRVHGVPCAHGGQVDLTGITQRDLGDLIGACRPFVSTCVNRLKREGVLGNAGRTVCLLDLQRLEIAAAGASEPLA